MADWILIYLFSYNEGIWGVLFKRDRVPIDMPGLYKELAAILEANH